MVGARRIVLRPLTEGESSTLEQRLREKRLPAKIYERYRIIDLVRDGMTPADHSSGTLVGHCHDRDRSFDLSPCLAALVRTESQPR